MNRNRLLAGLAGGASTASTFPTTCWKKFTTKTPPNYWGWI